MNKVDILKRLADSSCNESSHELQCRCFDAAEEISWLRAALKKWVDARNAPITGIFGLGEMEELRKAENELEQLIAVDKETGVR